MECPGFGREQRVNRVGKSFGDFNESIGAEGVPMSEAPTVARAAHLGEPDSTARLLSRSNNSFLVSIRFPMSEEEEA